MSNFHELVAPRGRCSGVLEQVLQRNEQEGERSSELVADVAEERGLCPIELGQCFGPSLLFLVSSGIGDSGTGIAGDEIEEAAVGGVEHATRIHSHQQKS